MGQRISRQEGDGIRLIIDRYLSLVRGENPEASESTLQLLLDRLALATHELLAESNSHPSAGLDCGCYQEWHLRAKTAFPGLGCYNSVRPVSARVGAATLVVADAINDIADIAVDLEEVARCWDHDPTDGLWHLENTFRYHWGERLRSLQLYLKMRDFGW